LQDPNAYAIYQLAKSLLLPKSLHRYLRWIYHKLRRSRHKPADYEFPTSVWQVARILRSLGFRDVEAHPNRAYPNVGPLGLDVYRVLSRSERIRKYHNWHYTLSATRP